MKKRHVLLVATVVLPLAVAAMLNRAHERELAYSEQLAARLVQRPLAEEARPAFLGSNERLPQPVRQYFQKTLTAGQMPICHARLLQTGALRVDTESSDWMQFAATELIVPGRGFVWNARIGLPYRAHLRVLDSLVSGTGSGRVSIMTVLPVAEDHDKPQLNSGALHRYLAEAAWFPTALLPEAGVRWTPIDEDRARAEFAMEGVSVSLEFRFNERNEIASVYSPARWGTFEGDYEQRAWEGRFRDYREIQGMRIPQYGEVGWYSDDELDLVWRGTIEDASFTLCR